MVTLAKRATPSQRRIFRAVVGAVKNVSDCHPESNITPRLARSIAKRATGTLTSQWSDVLAARANFVPSESAGMSLLNLPGHRWRHTSHGAPRRGPSYSRRRSPLRLLWKEFAIKVGEAKKNGQAEKVEAYIEILKRIANYEQMEQDFQIAMKRRQEETMGMSLRDMAKKYGLTP
jgi:hypothetical protein